MMIVNRPIFFISFAVAFVGFAMAVLGLMSNSVNPVNAYFVGGVVIAIVGAIVAAFGASRD